MSHAENNEKDAAVLAAAAAAPEIETGVPPLQPSEWTMRSILALLGTSLAFFCGTGFMNAFGIFQAYYQQHQLSNHSEFDISWLGSFGMFMMFACAPPAGLLTDKVGGTPLILTGAVLTVLSVFLISLCKEYYQFFLTQGLLLGGSFAFLFAPVLATIPRYFVKNRALGMGVAISGSSIGGVIWPIMLNQLLNVHGLSFGWTLRIVGFTMIPILTVTVLAVQPPRVQEQASGKKPVTGPTPKKKADLSVARKPEFILTAVGLAICYLGLFAPLFFITTYATGLGMSTSLSFYLVSIVNATSLFGRVLPGLLADRWGCFNLCTFALLLSGMIAMCWTAATTPAGLVVWAMAYGFTSGSAMSLQSSCVTQLATTPEAYGTALGLGLGAGALAGLFGAPIAGELIKHGALALSMYTGATLLLGGVLVGAARLKQSTRVFVKV